MKLRVLGIRGINLPDSLSMPWWIDERNQETNMVIMCVRQVLPKIVLPQKLPNLYITHRMWTPTRFDGHDPLGRQGLVTHQEFSVLAREDVICDGSDVVAIAEGTTQSEHQGGLTGTDGTKRKLGR